jgi:hypothetical protein
MTTTTTYDDVTAEFVRHHPDAAASPPLYFRMEALINK